MSHGCAARLWGAHQLPFGACCGGIARGGRVRQLPHPHTQRRRLRPRSGGASHGVGGGFGGCCVLGAHGREVCVGAGFEALQLRRHALHQRSKGLAHQAPRGAARGRLGALRRRSQRLQAALQARQVRARLAVEGGGLRRAAGGSNAPRAAAWRRDRGAPGVAPPPPRRGRRSALPTARRAYWSDDAPASALTALGSATDAACSLHAAAHLGSSCASQSASRFASSAMRSSWRDARGVRTHDESARCQGGAAASALQCGTRLVAVVRLVLRHQVKHSVQAGPPRRERRRRRRQREPRLPRRQRRGQQPGGRRRRHDARCTRAARAAAAAVRERGPRRWASPQTACPPRPRRALCSACFVLC